MFLSGCVFPHERTSSVYAFVIDIGDGFILEDQAVLTPRPLRDVERMLGASQRLIQQMHYLGTYNDTDCVLYVIDRREDPGRFVNAFTANLRTLFELWDSDVWLVAGYAWQIFEWGRNFRFCGRCGVETVIVDGERARRCEQCGLVNYPRISPSMIVRVQKGDEILLAKNAQFKRPFYSILAGFMEPGETLYECVTREVCEEVGVKVKNIRYFDSQYWPMSGSLMLGCVADYDSGEIKIDEKEIEHAAWFKADALPTVPSKRSIAGVMIDAFVMRHSNRKPE
ncbi:MAG: NAD(+) diphosphatase [Deltaproteobacteria bacterium]|nr:NAD(+) diphosphatase [Deltaproteobacteria bacterium]